MEAVWVHNLDQILQGAGTTYLKNCVDVPRTTWNSSKYRCDAAVLLCGCDDYLSMTWRENGGCRSSCSTESALSWDTSAASWWNPADCISPLNTRGLQFPRTKLHPVQFSHLSCFSPESVCLWSLKVINHIFLEWFLLETPHLCIVDQLNKDKLSMETQDSVLFLICLI